MDGAALNPLKEGVCAFHSADNAFAACDRQFPEARCHDCFCAWSDHRLPLEPAASSYEQTRESLAALPAKHLRKVIGS